MPFRTLADSVVLVHAVFALFVVAGGLLVLRWGKAAWVHVPCFLWGALVELAGWVCPLTYVEYWLRARAGAGVLSGDFVSRYVLPCLYPEGLTRGAQVALGATVLAVNIALYAFVAVRLRRSRKQGRALEIVSEG